MARHRVLVAGVHLEDCCRQRKTALGESEKSSLKGAQIEGVK